MLPQLFLDRMKQMLGAEYDEFLESLQQEKYQALRLNTLKKGMDGRNAAEILAPDEKNGLEKFQLRPVPWAENGYYYEKEEQPGKHPYHEAGVYYIQEPSAMAPVTLLEAKPGEKILDLCAAPGGKSTQIAGFMQGEGLLICNEIHPARAKILSENVERMGIRNACVTNETPQHLAQIFPEYFDRILVDAPCSGEGMFRKNEIACEEWSPENVELCGERQDEILDCAAKMLRPGGRLVYSTCTFAPTENEGSISRFVERHAEFEIQPIDKKALSLPTGQEMCRNEIVYKDDKASNTETDAARTCDGRTEWTENPVPHLQETLRLFPHLIQGEGHYAAVLQKAGTVPEQYESCALTGVEKGVSDKDLKEYKDFCQETLKTELKGKYVKFGENLYLVPENMPGLKGLKIMRPGLQVGTMKKNRFEPSHALALALSGPEVNHVWNLSSEESVIRAYLRGETFPAEGEKGWYLICVDGFSIGWGKLAGGIMKNHYPKGLRKM